MSQVVELAVVEKMPIGFDYAQFSDEQKEQIKDAVKDIKFYLLKTAEQIVAVGKAIHRLQEITGKSFTEVWEAELPEIGRRTAARYLNAYKFVQSQNLDNLHLVTPKSIYMIMHEQYKDNNADIVDLLKEKLNAGKEIKVADMQDMIREVTLKNDSLASTNEELKSDIYDLKKELEKIATAKNDEELKARRLQEVNQKLIKSEDIANSEIVTLAGEIKDLEKAKKDLENQLIEKERNPAVVEVPKEVTPRGYASVQEAIKDAERTLAEKQRALEEKQSALSEVNERLINNKKELLKTDLEIKALEENRVEVKKLFDLITDVTERYPSTVIAAMISSESKETKDQLLKIANTFKKFAKAIEDSI